MSVKHVLLDILTLRHFYFCVSSRKLVYVLFSIKHTWSQGQQPKIFDTLGANKAQRALLGTIEASLKTVERAEQDLTERVEFPDMGAKWREQKMTEQRDIVSNNVAAIGAATAQVVQLTGGGLVFFPVNFYELIFSKIL